ncbi:MAG: hypothetical protein IK123_03475, partial [Lachnospiraceae bacterium]|nr:hypothetical protein [Lachnospiraceae bacterium]
ADAYPEVIYRTERINARLAEVKAETVMEDKEPATAAVDHTVSEGEYMEDGRLDYSKVLFKPAERNDKLKWNDSVFSRIENVKEPDKAYVNLFKLTRKRVTLKDDDPMEIQIYKNPSSGKIEKITTVEDLSDKIDVIDYYYDDGNINYAAQRSMQIDRPIDISSGRITSRYYFNNDTLVRYSYCEDDKATVFNSSALSEYSEGTVSQYEYLESEMINKAYITYNAAESLPSIQHIEGYILDEYDQALVDVKVNLYKSSDMTEAASVLTDGDGHYEIDIPSDDDSSYILSASKDEFDETRIYDIPAGSDSGVYYVPTPRLTYASDGAQYDERIVVRDSVDNGVPITDASIKLRAGLNCREGDVIASSELDVEGSAVFNIQSGNYTAEVVKGGYENSYFNVIVTMARQITVGFAVKDVESGKMQIVLAWDSSPLDLDARLITSADKNEIRAIQDGLGTLLTETISLNVSETEEYRYYVSDYTDCIGGDASSDSLTGSGARVFVYGSEGFMESYDVPAGHLGVVWEPFIIRNGKVIPVNHYYNVIEEGSYWTAK